MQLRRRLLCMHAYLSEHLGGLKLWEWEKKKKKGGNQDAE